MTIRMLCVGLVAVLGLAACTKSEQVAADREPHLPTCQVRDDVARDIRDIRVVKESIDRLGPKLGDDDDYIVGARDTLDKLRLRVLKECSEQQVKSIRPGIFDKR